MFRKLIRGLILMTLIVTSPIYAPTSLAAPAYCDHRANDTQEMLLECVTLAGVREHLEAFEAIARTNGGTRATGTSGYDASLAYVVQTMTAAGYNVTLNAFSLPTLQQRTSISAPYRTDSFIGMSYGDVCAAMYLSGGLAQVGTHYSVIAESKDGDPNTVVMAGAHLDSVSRGPGINDNGSGSAALLEVAEQMAKVKPRNKVRFAWWGAEEYGLVGSSAYVRSLSQAERDRIALYLNFDMVGSPNHVFFIFDGDDSDRVGAGPGPRGSAAIEKTFERYFTEIHVPFKGTDLTGRSDYAPFIAKGIPFGGLFTGGDRIKREAEVALWGGVAGQPYDPCYHRACDTLNNVNLSVLDTNSDAIAYAVLHYAMDTSDLNEPVSQFVVYCSFIMG